MVSGSRLLLLTLAALLLFGGLVAANLCLGDLNQDEGWYLYAGLQMAKGHLPYRDFAFTQGPMMAAAYALAAPAVERFGVAGGRAFTAGVGLLALLFAGWLAIRQVPAGARCYAFLVTFTLAAVNVYHTYFTTIVKTYSVCALFLVTGLLAVSFARSPRGAVACFISGLLLAAAAAVRVSAGIALPVTGAYLLYHRGRLGHSCWIGFAAGAVLGLAGAFLPFAIMAPEGLWFCLVEYHSLREAGSLMSTLAQKAGFLSRFARAYVVAIAAGLALLFFRRAVVVGAAAERDDAEAIGQRFPALLWAVGIAITLVHFLAPFPYDDYQVFVAPVLIAALAGSCARALHGWWLENLDAEVRSSRGAIAWRALLLLFAASALASFTSPINQEWIVYGRDRIWWLIKEESALCRLQRAAARVQDLGPGAKEVFTQDTYLAVEAGLSVPPGLDMGPFSYFPEMPTDQARRVHVLNRELLLDLLARTEAPVAAISGYGLSIASPAVEELPAGAQEELWTALRQRYREVESIPHFGQAHTTLHLLTRAEPEPPPEAAP